jgi:nicotinamidase-related amidase
MLDISRSVFVLVDVQGRLAELMYERAKLSASLVKWVSAMQRLAVPVLWVEQNPARLGPTIRPLSELLTALKPIPKQSFSCVGEPVFMNRLQDSGRQQVVVAGIEAHVCVYQTVADLLERKYQVFLAADAVSSRTASNRDIGLQRAAMCGALLTSLEMALFEMLRSAEHPAFRDIQRIVK